MTLLASSKTIDRELDCVVYSTHYYYYSPLFCLYLVTITSKEAYLFTQC